MADPNTPSSNGQPDGGAKMVPEADLMALKSSHESAIRTKDAELTASNASKDSALAAQQAAEAKLSDVSEVQTKLTNAETENTNLKSRVGELETASTTMRRDHLVTAYSIPEDKLKGFNDAQLSALESTLPGVKPPSGPPPNANNLDASGNANGTPGIDRDAIPRERIKTGLAADKASSGS